MNNIGATAKVYGNIDREKLSKELDINYMKHCEVQKAEEAVLKQKAMFLVKLKKLKQSGKREEILERLNNWLEENLETMHINFLKDKSHPQYSELKNRR